MKYNYLVSPQDLISLRVGLGLLLRQCQEAIDKGQDPTLAQETMESLKEAYNNTHYQNLTIADIPHEP